MTAAENYVPKVGDRVRLGEWPDGDFVDVVLVGRTTFYGRSMLDVEFAWGLDLPWIKVEPPLVWPERWLNVYDDEVGPDHRSRTTADIGEHRTDRIGVIHLAADGTITLEAL